jgi:hypothetical protein
MRHSLVRTGATAALTLTVAAAALGAQRPGRGPQLPPRVAVPAPALAAVSDPELPRRLLRGWSCSPFASGDWSSPAAPGRGWLPVTPDDAAGWPHGVLDSAGIPRPGFEPERHEWLQHLISPFGPAGTPGTSGKTFFRRALEFGEAFAGCSTYVGLDNAYQLFVNGTQVGGSRQSAVMAREFSIQNLLRPGRNVIGLAVANEPARPSGVVWTDLHEAVPVRGDRPMLWRCALTPASGWEQPGFDDRRWLAAGRVPFNDHFGIQGRVSSDPIWYPNSESASVAYFRYPLILDGAPNYGAIDIVADNAWELWVNGELVGVERRHLNPAVVRTIDASRLLRPGRNLIAVKACNYGGPAALACVPRVKLTF